MTLQCRIVLKELQKLSDYTETELSFLGESTCICLSSNYDKIYNYSKYQNEIVGIIQQLADDGYLTYTRNNHFFTLTHKALHRHQFKWEIFKSFLIKSVLVPIFVAFITTLITLWLTK